MKKKRIHHLKSQRCSENHKTHFRIWHRTHRVIVIAGARAHAHCFTVWPFALVWKRRKKSVSFSCAVTIFFLRFALTHTVNSFEMPWYQEPFSFLFHEIPLEHLSVELLLPFYLISFAFESICVVQFYGLWFNLILSPRAFLLVCYLSTRIYIRSLPTWYQQCFFWVCSVCVCFFYFLYKLPSVLKRTKV